MKDFFTKIWTAVKQWPGIVWDWIKENVFDNGAGWAVASGAVATLLTAWVDRFWAALLFYIAAFVFSKWLVTKLSGRK